MNPRKSSPTHGPAAANKPARPPAALPPRPPPAAQPKSAAPARQPPRPVAAHTSAQNFARPSALQPKVRPAPPVYRPQPAPRVLQPKPAAEPPRTPHAPAAARVCAPCAPRPAPRPARPAAPTPAPPPSPPRPPQAVQRMAREAAPKPRAGVVQAFKFYPNLHPGAVEPVERGSLFRLENFTDQYRLRKTEGHGAYVPNQLYNFVRTSGGETLLHNRYRHPSIAEGRQVLYAGEASFNNGRLEWWSNGSGHYQPDAGDAAQAALPMDNFYTYQQVIKGEHKRRKA